MNKSMSSFPIIRKRDGRLTRFEKKKIQDAIYKSLYATGIDSLERSELLCEIVVNELLKTHAGAVPQVEEIQDIVEKILIQEGHIQTAKAYILYRAKRTSIREGRSELMDSMEDILKETHSEIPFGFKSPGLKLFKVAIAASCNYYLSRIIPSQYADAHRKGEIYIHALEYYGKTIDSLQIPLYRLLKNGFSTGYGYHRPPKRYSSLIPQITVILQSCQNDMSGCQSFPDFDKEVGKYLEENIKEDENHCFQAMEGLIYNLNTIYSMTPEQIPQSSISIGLDTSNYGRMISKNILLALQKGLGRGETPIFPKIIFNVRESVNYHPEDPNYDLFRLAIEVSSKRMNPCFCFIDNIPENSNAQKIAYWGDGSRIINNISGESSPQGRGMIASVTINLPRIALWISHKRNDFLIESFFNELQRVINLAACQLNNRMEMISHLKVKELPFIMGEGVYLNSEHLNPEDEIKSSIKNGLLAISFTGLSEALFILKGAHHGEDSASQDLGLQIIEFMRSRVDEIAEENHLNFVLSSASSERITHEFALLDRQEYGIVSGITDKPYYTTSFHIPSDYKITVEERLRIESPYHKLCNGGHFSFITSSSAPDTDKLESVLRKMKNSGVGYGGITFPLDECLDCGNNIIQYGKCSLCESTVIRNLRRTSTQIYPLSALGEAQKMELAARTGKENI